jgi:hypothetical protein
MTVLSSLVLIRYFVKMNRLVTATLATGAILGTTASVYYAVPAEDQETDAKLVIALMQQLMSPLESKLSQFKNTMQVLNFYSKLQDAEIMEYISGRYFMSKTKLFEQRFRLSVKEKAEVDRIQLSLAQLRLLPSSALLWPSRLLLLRCTIRIVLKVLDLA